MVRDVGESAYIIYKGSEYIRIFWNGQMLIQMFADVKEGGNGCKIQ